jgi:lipoprotein NlpD
VNWFQYTAVALVSTLALGCATPVDEINGAPVISMQDQPKVIPSRHTVKSGESIYSIAWLYDADYKNIAKANNIEFPYVIKKGQQLSLKDSTVATKPVKKKVAAKTKPAASVKHVKVLQGDSNSNWLWPVDGKLIQSFSESKGNPHKGIDIVNSLGTNIIASNSGKVVYSGDGLRGYGKLIIIKHNNDYLSAYAHNSRLFVKEGEQVSKGQHIADMGSSESENIKLHFEIRKNGQPIDPLDKLPPKINTG